MLLTGAAFMYAMGPPGPDLSLICYLLAFICDELARAPPPTAAAHSRRRGAPDFSPISTHSRHGSAPRRPRPRFVTP